MDIRSFDPVSARGGTSRGDSNGARTNGKAAGSAATEVSRSPRSLTSRTTPSTLSDTNRKGVNTKAGSASSIRRAALADAPSKASASDAGSMRRAINGGNQTGKTQTSYNAAGNNKSKSKYKYKYKYKYQYKYQHGGGKWGYGYSWYDCYVWKTNIHPYLPFTYFPGKYSWYSYWFGLHPAYSSYWWCEWWPYYSVYPQYVSYYPTYVPVTEQSTVVYYPVDQAPQGVDVGQYAQPATAPNGNVDALPQQSISPSFERELAALAANESAVQFLEDGALQFKEGQFAEAADSFRQAMLAERNNAVPKFAMAHSLFAAGEYSYAAFLLRRGIEILPEWPSVGADLRDLYGNPDDLAEHTIALQVYLNAHPDDIDGHALAGYVGFFSGDLDVAETEFTAVATADPADPVAATFLARISEIRAALAAEGVPAAAHEIAAPPADGIDVDAGG